MKDAGDILQRHALHDSLTAVSMTVISDTGGVRNAPGLG